LLVTLVSPERIPPRLLRALALFGLVPRFCSLPRRWPDATIERETAPVVLSVPLRRAAANFPVGAESARSPDWACWARSVEVRPGC